MHIENRPLKFSTITHHASVTQCLGSVGGNVWYLGVAKPSIVDDYEVKDDTGGNNEIVQSRCGHFYVPPAVESVRVFRVEGSKFLKLNRGTWHAGPLFKADTMDFYNLELSNTNVSSLSKLVLKFMYAFWCICKATLELWSDLSSASNLFWIKHYQGRPCAYKHDKYACVLFYVIIFLGIYFNVSLSL